MKNKQEFIIRSAQKCFIEQGIKHTSIDDIVKECKISKSTFYKFFPTKEDLIWEMLIYSSEKFAFESILIDEDDTKSSSEKLKEKIQLVLNYLKYNSSFDSTILEFFSQAKDKDVLEIKNKMKANIINCYKAPLILIYGEEINSIIWELIFVIDSIVHEFNVVMKINKRNIGIEYIFEFITRQLELNIENLKIHKVIINETIFYSIDEIGESNYKDSIKDIFISVIHSMKDCIYSINENKKLSIAIEKIEEEFRLENYSSLTMDAMIAYLEKYDFLQAYTVKLNRLISKLGDDINSGE